MRLFAIVALVFLVFSRFAIDNIVSFVNSQEPKKKNSRAFSATNRHDTSPNGKTESLHWLLLFQMQNNLDILLFPSFILKSNPNQCRVTISFLQLSQRNDSHKCSTWTYSYPVLRSPRRPCKETCTHLVDTK